MTKEIIEILSPALGDDLAKDILAHRRGKKCPLTARGAKALLREYEATGNAVAAAEEHLNRGWQGFKAEWMTKGKNFSDPHNPMPLESPVERAQRMQLENDFRWARNEGDTKKQEQIKRLLEGAIRK
jgi:hypothetical protein